VSEVYVAVLTSGWVRHELAAQLVAFLDDRRYKLELHFSYDRPTPSNRNGICKRFLVGGAGWLLMIDHDTVPYRNPLDLVERDLDVVTFPYPIWRKGTEPPLTVSLATMGDGPEEVRLGEGVREVLWGGTGMVLIARRVLEHPDMRAPFAYRYDEDGLKVWEEDSYFCWRARRAGFRIWSALSHPCGHVKELDLADVHGAVERWMEVKRALDGQGRKRAYKES
jgi:hypothetical protein